MESQEKKTKGAGLTDELDLEPLNLDFDLQVPPLDDELQAEPELTLAGLPDQEGMWAEVPAPGVEGVLAAEEEGPITLTADELNDIVSADLKWDTEGGAVETELGTAPPTPHEVSQADFSDLKVPEFDENDLAFLSEPDLTEAAEFVPEAFSPEKEELDLEAGPPEDLSLDFSLPGETEEVPVSEGLPPEMLDIDFGPGQETEAAPLAVDTSNFSPFEAEALSSEGELEPSALVTPGEEEELVSLSEEELDSILGDVEEGGAVSEEEHEEEFGFPMGEEAPAAHVSIEEPEDEMFGEMPPSSTSILDADEDESITLTADELSNIVSGEALPLQAAPPEEVESQPVPSSEISFFHDETEEGPVALTDAELADIMEGTVLEEEAPPSPVAPPRAERMADELSMETGLKRDELKRIIGYLDDLLGQLPEDTVREFSRSEYFNLYKKVIEDLGIYH